MSEIKTTYRSCLLRLWREDQDEGSWRVMMEDITDSGQRHYFKDLESLVAYLPVWAEDRMVDVDGGE